MTQQIITEKTFKPFVIESQRQHRTLFRVVECSGGVRRDQLEPLLEQLPIRFQLRQRLTGDDVREPLDVYVSGPIVEIYPPRDRILVGSSIESWGAVELTRHMKMDNIADMTSVYCRQIRSCVHFSPQIFGVVDWPDLSDGEIEVDIFAYPKGIENYLQPVAPIFDSFQVKDLLGLIAGGKDLTVSRVQKWRSLIMYAVLSMRSCYDRPELASYPVSQYYSENWRRIDAAQDDEELTRALESLVTAITWK